MSDWIFNCTLLNGSMYMGTGQRVDSLKIGLWSFELYCDSDREENIFHNKNNEVSKFYRYYL